MSRIAFILIMLALIPMNEVFPEEMQRVAHYGVWEPYAPGIILKYPDFALEFLGVEQGSPYPGSATHRLGNIYKFRLSAESSTREVRWSAGTGEIAPCHFTLGGQDYVFEMLSSEAVGEGFVSDDKIMLWRKADWQKKMEKRRKALNQRFGL